jgi:hypothetical protein
VWSINVLSGLLHARCCMGGGFADAVAMRVIFSQSSISLSSI